MPDTAVTAPLQNVEKQIVTAFADIEAWLRREYSATPPPFYCSVDCRNNGSKIAPVDTNLFPGGFNNLAAAHYPLAAEMIQRQVGSLCPNVKSLLLIPENHTRNLHYFDNIAVLKQLIEMAGIQVKVGRLDGAAVQLTSAGGVPLDMLPVACTGGRLHCGDFYPCAAVLNNDLSGGLPPLLAAAEIPLLPPPQLGWALRKKSQHFYQYNRVAEQFAGLIGADPWLFSPHFHVCNKIDFHKREGMECLAAATDETLAQIKEKYREHNISDEPYVVLKADAGTYGRGVMTVQDATAVLNLNRRERNRMATGKEGIKSHDILIQEGIGTVETVDGNAAEPVVYMVGGSVVGGFYRINTDRGNRDNLNSSGMYFSPLPFAAGCAPPLQQPDNHAAAQLYIYSVIGRLANLAAAREIAALPQTAGR